MERLQPTTRTRRWTIAVLGAAVFGACGEGADRTDTGLAGDTLAPTTTGAPAAGTTGMQQGQLTDGNIAAILQAADQAEIQPSQTAQERAENPEVRQFAEQMVRDHTVLTDSLRALTQRQNVTPEENQRSQQLQSQTQSTQQRLQGLSGAEFDRQYMQYMVESHQMTLDAVQNQLIPAAQNPEMRRALEQQVRPAVQQHLEHARQLQGNLGEN